MQANNATKVYGQTAVLAPTDFTTPVAPQNGETVGSVTETSAGTVATAAVPGPYAITPSGASGGTFNPANYVITYVNGALAVTPAPLTVQANNATKVYGQTAVLAPIDFTTPVAPQNGETVGSVTETSAGTVATAAVPGPYAITPSGASGGTFNPSNYTITYVNGALAVTPANLLSGVPPVQVSGNTMPGFVQGHTVNPSLSMQTSGLNLTVMGTGVRMPPIEVAETTPVEPDQPLDESVSGPIGPASKTPPGYLAPSVRPNSYRN